MTRLFVDKIATLLFLLLTCRTVANDPPQYNRDVLPILANHCFACHGADSGSREAGLRLDQREAALEFGAFVPGEPEHSELLARVLEEDPDLQMPPPEFSKPLTDEQKQVLHKWIAAGGEYQAHWSFLVPQKPALPEVQNSKWVKTPVDQFVLSKLESLGWSPQPEAEPTVLFRRLHLDITGLPPQPEAVREFVDDYRQGGEASLSAWIDRLMDQSEWGEHRARYWLDAARYADTHGLHFDNYREMWLYRDWVIRAFNNNQPFDQFTIEQLAGDLLENPSEDQLVATGFQRCNITTNEGGTIDEENLANYAVDRVQTFGWVYLGLTTNCAQCHDHKFDAFTMKDFYSLAAFFRNTTQGPLDGNVKDGRGPILIVPSDQDRSRWEALPEEIAAAKSDLAAYEESAKQASEAWAQELTREKLLSQLPTDSLLLHLPLDEGRGETCRVVLEGSQAELTVQPPATAQWKVHNNHTGYTLSADTTLDLGQLDQAELGNFRADQPFSYGAWVLPRDNKSSGSILARMDVNAEHRGWDLWQNGDRFSVHLIDTWPTNAVKVSTKDAVVKPDNWQHVFATYDGSGSSKGIKLYIDGQLQENRVDTDNLASGAQARTQTTLRIGQRSQGAVLQDAALRDVRIYSRELSSAEVLELAQHANLLQYLVTAAEERTQEQRQGVFQYYIATQDDKYATLNAQVNELQTELDAIKARSPLTHIQQEKVDTPPTAHILMRGQYDQPGEQVVAAVPQALHPMLDSVSNNRMGLAMWVVDPANPLTARVTVNRFWQEVFGQGIVTTPEDFGVMGSPPSHPELLDWLARDFQENGWDVKRFFKLLLMSATYRQAAAGTAEQFERDPDNRWLSRGPRFRMDAEMVRDSALAISGLLSSKMYGPSVKPYQPEGIWSIVGLPGGDTRDYSQSEGEDLFRRSLYTFWKRMAPPPNLEAFNATSREVCTVRRERTNTPLQALVTLNDPQFVEAARVLAEQVVQSCSAEACNDQQRFQKIAGGCLSREFDEQEISLLAADLEAYRSYYSQNPEDAERLLQIGSSPRRSQSDCGELAAWTMICNQVLNLDETLNK